MCDVGAAIVATIVLEKSRILTLLVLFIVPALLGGLKVAFEAAGGRDGDVNAGSSAMCVPFVVSSAA